MGVENALKDYAAGDLLPDVEIEVMVLGANRVLVGSGEFGLQGIHWARGNEELDIERAELLEEVELDVRWSLIYSVEEVE